MVIITGGPRGSPGQRVGQFFVAEITEPSELLRPLAAGGEEREGPPGRSDAAVRPGLLHFCPQKLKSTSTTLGIDSSEVRRRC